MVIVWHISRPFSQKPTVCFIAAEPGNIWANCVVALTKGHSCDWHFGAAADGLSVEVEDIMVMCGITKKGTVNHQLKFVQLLWWDEPMAPHHCALDWAVKEAGVVKTVRMHGRTCNLWEKKHLKSYFETKYINILSVFMDLWAFLRLNQ